MNNSPVGSIPTSEVHKFIYKIPFNEVEIDKTERLGSGTFGTVHRGKWRNLDVAVKVFRQQREIESFNNELKMLSEIRHDNIVHLYGSLQTAKEAYLIMELSDCSLSDLLHAQPDVTYDLRHACYWAYQAASGLSYCHDLKPTPLIHRDLKPDNLLLFNGGKRLKICDFGTAVSQRSTMTNNTGTVCYMDPEVFAGVHYDTRCDVFSWAIMFWEILARKRPYFDRKNNIVHKLQIDICEKHLRPHRLISCPSLIWNLIGKSWSGNLNDRPYMKQVVKDVELICRIAGVKSNRNTQQSSNFQRSNSSRHQKSHHESNRASISGITSQNARNTNTTFSESSNEHEDLIAKMKKYYHLRAMDYRLNLVNKRREFLEKQEDYNLSNMSDEVDELKELKRIIESMK